MNELSQFLVESILLGEADSVDNKVVVYAGRFQPFHKGHYATYSHLVKKFGKNNVYIGTSNKTDNNKSPFNFKEKVMIITKMFGIPSSRIIEVKNPYVPTEVLKKFDKDTTAFITVVGKKDASRLGGKFFTPYKDNLDFEGYEDKGYVYIAPNQSNPISGTDVRNGLKSGSEDDKKNFFSKRAYPKFDKKIFGFITNTLNEERIITKEMVESWLIQNVDLIKEATSTMGKASVDDGPNYIFPSFAAFDRVSKKRAEEIGYTVLSQIMSDELTDIDPHPIYPNGPVKAVTPFPAGVAGKTTATNQKDYYGSQAYSKWLRHVTRLAGLVGYSLVDFADTDGGDEKSQSLRDLGAEKKDSGNTVSENITIPINVGDTVLGGKFKNKRIVVKTIGKNEKGDITINGKSILRIRVIEESTLVEVIFEDEKEDERYTHIGYGKFKQKGKEKDTNSPTFQKDDSGKYTKLDKDGESSQQEKPKGQSLTKGAAGDSFQNELPNDDPAKQEKDWTSGKDGWEILDDDRAKVKKIRKYLDKEYEEETGEYFENDVSKKVAPNAFKDKSDMIQKMKDAKPTFLSSEEMQNMGNTDVADILSASEDGGKDSMLKLGKERAKEYGKDWDRLEKGIKSNSPVPSPMALRDKNGDLHLLAGNTRLMSFTASGKKLPVKVIDYDGEFQYNESVNEIAGTEIKCEKCNHQWEIESDDSDKYLCHNCGWDSHKQKLDIAGLYKWKESNSMLEELSSEDRTLIYQLTTQALKQMPKSKKQKEVIKKLNKVRVKNGMSPLKEDTLNEIPMADLQKIDKFADKQLNPVNIVLTGKHFFDRLNDPRNGKEVSNAELIGFFKRLGKNKKEFVKFLNQYNQIVVKDNRTNINIPFMKQANNVIAKTIMRKDDFKTSDPKYKFEDKISEGLLTEGGAYGHMNHPFDTEINLTFGQLKDIVNKALEGNLDLAREKTDGQALAVSWRDGRLVAARNKGHLKNKGENALDIKGVATKFAGRGELEKAYNFAMNDLSKAIKSLSEKQRDKIFKGGACFMNLEVIYPTSVNVIPYGQALLVFHGTMEFNEEGIAIGENQDAAKILAGMIKQVNQDVQSAYTISGPPINELPKSKNLTSLKGKYNSKISKLQSKFKLKDNDGIADYHQAFWMDFVNKKSPSKLDNRTLMGLVKRWAFYEKSFRLDKKNLSDEKTLEWAKGIDKNDHAKMAKDNIRPFEDIFLGIGADILSFMSSVLTANPDKAIRAMKKQLDKTIKDVRKSGDVKKIAKLKMELQRLKAIGGTDKIVPNEGIVFVYGGKTFKLTGTFAPLNQILGLFYE